MTQFWWQSIVLKSAKRSAWIKQSKLTIKTVILLYGEDCITITGKKVSKFISITFFFFPSHLTFFDLDYCVCHFSYSTAAAATTMMTMTTTSDTISSHIMWYLYCSSLWHEWRTFFSFCSHSTSAWPQNKRECRRKKEKKYEKNWKLTLAIIIDEVSRMKVNKMRINDNFLTN